MISRTRRARPCPRLAVEPLESRTLLSGGAPATSLGHALFASSYAALHLRPAATTSNASAPAGQTTDPATSATPLGLARVDQATPPTFIDALTVDVDPDGAAGAVIRYQATEPGAYTATARWDNGPAELAWIDQPGANNHAPGVGAAYALHDPLPPGEHTLRITITHAATGAAATAAATFTVEAIDGFALGVLPANEPSADLAGSVESEEGAVTEPPSAPAVAAVYVSSSAWTSTFKDNLAANALGHATYGYTVPANDQLNTLPWTNLDTVSVTFTEDVEVGPADLLVRGVTFSEYTVDAASFVYDDSTFTATWEVDGNPALDGHQYLPNDKLLLHVTNFVQDADGNRLDGEWTNGADAFPSGDSQPDGVFQFRINVLPADAYRSGGVNSNDIGTVRAREGRSTTNPGDPGTATYNVFADVNGTGDITGDPGDLGEVRARWPSTLPAGEPAAPVLPAAPASPAAVPATPWRVAVTWADNAVNETGFVVENSIDGSSDWVANGWAGADATSLNSDGLQELTTYYHRVVAYNDAGQSVPSAAVPATTLLAAPEHARAVAQADGQVKLTWWDASVKESGVRVERSTDGGATYAVLGEAPADATAFTDASVAPGRTYHYRARNLSGALLSNSSAVAQTTTIPAVPTNVTAAAASDGSIALSWDDVEGESEYVIQQQTPGSAFFQEVARLPTGSTSYTASGLPDGTPASLTVAAANGSGSSPPSASASATTVLAAPSGLTVEQYRSVGLLTWADNADNEQFYTVTARDESGVSTDITLEPNSTAYNFFAGDYGGDWTFEVRAGGAATSAAATTSFAFSPVTGLGPAVTVYGPNAVHTSETGGPGSFTLYREGDTASALDVRYSLSGTAQAGEDYNPPTSNTVRFAAGSDTAVIEYTPKDDKLFERGERVSLVVHASDRHNGHFNVALGGNYPSVIADDDLSISIAQPLITVGVEKEVVVSASDANGQAFEGTFTVIASGGIEAPSSVSTGPDGTGTLTVKGVAAGAAAIRLQNQRGDKEVPLQVKNQELLLFAPELLKDNEEITIHVGQMIKVGATLWDAERGAIKDQKLVVTNTNPNSVEIPSPPPPTNVGGITEIPVVGRQATPAGQPATITVQSPTDPQAKKRVRVIVKDVKIEFDRDNYAVVVGNNRELTARVTDAGDGRAVKNVNVNFTINGNTIANNSFAAPVLPPATDAGGVVRMRVLGVAVGPAATVTVQVKGSPTNAKDTATVTVLGGDEV